ncbi:unnamed protein product, partial [Brachionus calyciflorus]
MESYHFNEDQLKYLRDFFEKNKIPNQDDIEKIRKNLGKEISKRDISIWFYKSRLSQNKNDQTLEEMDTNFSENNQSIDFDSEILKKNMRCSILSSKIETKNPIINKQMKKGRKSNFTENQLFYLRNFFENNNNPSQFEIEEILISLGKEFSAKQINNWFANNRSANLSKNYKNKKIRKNVNSSPKEISKSGKKENFSVDDDLLTLSDEEIYQSSKSIKQFPLMRKRNCLKN